MNVSKINGLLFKTLMQSGANNLANDYRRVDDLNVFPVPDGDTGTNMKMTIQAGVSEIKGDLDDSLDVMAKKLSRGLLMGARGNSGVILSQLFRGLHKGIEGNDAVDAMGLLEGFKGGFEQAYKSVMNPVEGTMLTVAREATEGLAKVIKPDMTINEVLKHYLDAANASLEHTPELLPKLKEAGVVDSGGVGYVLVIEGMYKAIQGNPVELSSNNDYESDAAQTHIEHDEFGYCTEFIIDLAKTDDVESVMKEQLAYLGDSIVVVQDEDLLKVHVHTLTPGDALNIGQKYGEFRSLKIENMQLQHEHIMDAEAPKKPVQNKKYGIVAVAQGSGLEKTFYDFGVDYVVTGGQTMNPSTEDIVKAVAKVHADNVLVFPNNKNILLAAEQAKELVEDKNVIVVPAKTIAEGYSALSILDLNHEPDAILDEIEASIEVVLTGEVTYAVRDTSIGGVTITKGDWMGIENGKIVSSHPEAMNTIKALLHKMLKDAEIITIIVGEDAPEEELHNIEAYITEKYEDVEIDVIEGKQAVYNYIFAVE